MGKLEKWKLIKEWLAVFKKRLLLFTMMFVIPISLSFLLGYTMDAKQINNIPTVIVDHDNTSLSRGISEEIRSNEVFNIVKYSQNDGDVENYIENGKAMVGIVIPKSYSDDLVEGKGPNVLVLYDGSQMSITSAAKSRMSEILLTIKTGYMEKVMEGKLDVVPSESLKTAQPMYFSYRLLNNPTKNYVNFLLPGMLIAVIQVGFVEIGVDRVRKKGEKFRYLMAKAICWSVLGTISLTATLWVQHYFFGMPYKGTISAGLLLTLLFPLAMISFGMFIMNLIPNKLLATQVGVVMVLPASVLGGYTFPLMAMPKTFQTVGWLLPFTHYAEPIRDLVMKDINMKYVLGDVKWLLAFTAIMWAGIAVLFFGKKYVKSLWHKRHDIKAVENI